MAEKKDAPNKSKIYKMEPAQKNSFFHKVKNLHAQFHTHANNALTNLLDKMGAKRIK